MTPEEQSKKIERRRSRDPGWLYLGLAILTFIVFCPLLGAGFLTYGDPVYVTENPHVQAGLTWPGILWAFHTTATGSWMPLTWISHMVDTQIFGVSASGHHLVNILLHVANTLLLFFALNRMTGALWRSGIVAILFALHPAHVETVAWISERKGLLSVFFWMLAFYAYANYAGKPNVFRYLLALVLAACGLMCSPEMVAIPFLLLIMDFWPLRRTLMAAKRHPSKRRIDRSARFHPYPMPRLLLEKLPFFAMSIAVCAVTLRARGMGNGIASGPVPIGERAGLAAVSCVNYIFTLVFPRDLSVFYPNTSAPARWMVWMAGAALIVVSWIALTGARRRPFLFSGWFWFLGTLVPMSGLVWIGDWAGADRYTYLPFIGLFIVIAWSSAELAKRYPILKGIASVVAIAPMIATCIQVKFWKDTRSLFDHAVEVNPNNYLAYTVLGDGQEAAGKPEQAAQLYTKALHCAPDNARAAHIHFLLGKSLERQGKLAEAHNEFQEASKLRPGTDQIAPENVGGGGQGKKI